MKKVSFRAPNNSDIHVLVDLVEQLGYKIDDSQMKKNILEHSTNPFLNVKLAILENKIVGCIAFCITKYFHISHPLLQITTMIVDKNHRRKGIGRQLMQIAIDFASKMDCCQIVLSTGMHRNEAHDFYKKNGFVELNGTKKIFSKKLDSDSI